MNILVIGNGFDLAHGLPTKYTDFLNWIVDEYELYENLKPALKGLNIKLNVPDIKKKTKKTSYTYRVNGQQEELLKCIDDNSWIEYFLYCQMNEKTNWIDFESEISKVIRSIERNMKGNLDNKVTYLDNKFLSMKYIDGKRELKFSDLRDILLNDLNKLIRALELYLCGYVEIMEIKKKSPDIESLKIDNVISFNYTNTFSKLYGTTGRIGKNKSKSFDYIHGQASINNTIKSNNMVLGIDEYLSDDRMNRDVEFITFKKYYQRIYKQTGSQYKDWVEKIRNSWKETEWIKNKFFMQIPFFKFKYRHFLYIFGHSLDVTDKDILRDLILNDNVYTTIFYHKTYDDYGNDDNGRTDLGIKITNLVKVIGQEELIRRTGGGAKTIEFKLQADMRNISGHMDLIERVIKAGT